MGQRPEVEGGHFIAMCVFMHFRVSLVLLPSHFPGLYCERQTMSKLTWLMIMVSSKHMFLAVYGKGSGFFFCCLFFEGHQQGNRSHVHLCGFLTCVIFDVFHINTVTCCGLGWSLSLLRDGKKTTLILMSKCVFFGFFSSYFLPWHQNWRMSMFASACQNSAAHRAHKQTLNSYFNPEFIKYGFAFDYSWN